MSGIEGLADWAPLRVVRSLVGCRRGVAAIEFGYLVPVMFAMFAGIAEFSQLITLDRRVSHVASATADIVARQKTVDVTQLSGYTDIVSHLLSPYDDTLLKMTILNVYGVSDADDDDIPKETKVCWSYNRQVNGSDKGTKTYTKGEVYPLPTGLVEEGTSVVVVEVEYDYQPVLFKYFIKTAKTLTEKFYLKPRRSASVKLNSQANCV